MAKSKTDIAKKHIKENEGKLSKRALAKLIYDLYPKHFTSVEDARCFIRYAVGEYGEKKRNTTNIVKWNIPEGDKYEYKDFIMPQSASRLLILPDMHFPHHDVKALETALNDGIKNNCNSILINGDGLDFHKLSKYTKDKSNKEISEELEYFRLFLKELKKNFDVPIYYKVGNHEYRYHRFLSENPQILGIKELDFQSIMRFGEYGITEIKSDQKIVCGQFNLWHGHEFMGSGGVWPAKWLFERTLESGACGHFHRISAFHAKQGDKNIDSYSMGCLCDLRPKYIPHQRATQKWSHGYGILNWDKEKYEFFNKEIR